MTVDNVNSTTSPYQNSIQSAWQQRIQDFKSLQNALQSGDLSGAQQAFVSLQQNQPAGSANGSNQNNPLAKDFQTLQSALQSGDLSGAQQALASLKQDMQTARSAHHGHHHHQSTSSTDSSSTSTSSVTTQLLDAQA